MHEKVVLIGAGSASFTRGLLADMIHAGWTGELALVDTDPKAKEVAQGLAQKMVKLGGVALKVSATTDRRNALPGATAVICTIGVGGRRAWEQDVFIPRRYGIYQPVGDSVMPGGSSRALRMIHAMVEIARDVQKLAPKALFINYGNPMSPVCRGIRKATGAQVIGLCHGVPHCCHSLEHLLGLETGQLGLYRGRHQPHDLVHRRAHRNGRGPDAQAAQDRPGKSRDHSYTRFLWLRNLARR